MCMGKASYADQPGPPKMKPSTREVAGAGAIRSSRDSAVCAGDKCEPAPMPNAPTPMTRLTTSLLRAVLKALLSAVDSLAGLREGHHVTRAGHVQTRQRTGDIASAPGAIETEHSVPQRLSQSFNLPARR
jgi:hypothetical protein